MPILDDWTWDVDAILQEHGVTLYDDGEPEGWGFTWKHGCIYIGQTGEQIAKQGAALFVSLWLRGVSASFCDAIMTAMLTYWERCDELSQST